MVRPLHCGEETVLGAGHSAGQKKLYVAGRIGPHSAAKLDSPYAAALKECPPGDAGDWQVLLCFLIKILSQAIGAKGAPLPG